MSPGKELRTSACPPASSADEGHGPIRARRGLAAVATSLREAPSGVLVTALVVGAGAGLGAIAFRWLIVTFTHLFSGHADYSAAGHASNPRLPWLGPWFVLLAPVVGGLLYGPLVQRFAREARGHGVPEVMFAVAQRGGRIAPRVAVVKSLASALCIGSGGSVGREGPIVQIGSALGSSIGQALRLTENRLRILVACGAAGGIAATFNAPLAGVFFAMELILRDFTAESFGAVVLASVTASVVGRAALGDTAFLQLPAFHVSHPAEYLLYAGLGVLAGAAGVGFTRVLYLVEDLCDWAWRGPEWLRPAAGGLVLGGLLLALPQMYGVGYPVLENAIGGRYLIGFLLLLLAGKALATSLTIGIGGSGGVFAPSLFMGAMAGSAYGIVAHHLAPGLATSPGAYGLVGMGAVFAGAARAPITAVIIMFELTGEYSIILPLMLAIVLATVVSRVLSGDTIYTLKLRRRGVDLDAHEPVNPLATTPVGEVMEPVPPSLPDTTALEEAARLLVTSDHGVLPVTASDGRYRGTVTARAAAEALTDGDGRPATIGELAELPTPVIAHDALADALHVLVTTQGTGVPVLADDRTAIVGWITHQTILGALRTQDAGHG
ncbi:chloride channel protein [Actinoallomurus iriomotensis]|uniref:Transport integral membrane protein n=1 Tax=Actinoallomurus iriomotensis TaxID=478107 RepID=A0A9W6RUE1_9ACTN|nr:chloride channel protein [Actinoallomurus iriomotensis]GLY80297.1 transport integral membrane protein [Actinoallomurus iriomotensis]